jgi:hypothetical protein
MIGECSTLLVGAEIRFGMSLLEKVIFAGELAENFCGWDTRTYGEPRGNGTSADVSQYQKNDEDTAN